MAERAVRAPEPHSEPSAPVSAPGARHEGLEQRPASRAAGAHEAKLNARAAERTLAPPNRTGIPDMVKASAETVSGLSMDDVRVRRGSPEPARIGAHAFTRGAEVHLGPGQERHLAHELGHVIQQKRGLVKPTLQMKGVAINDEPRHELGADRLGATIEAGAGKTSGLALPRADLKTAATGGAEGVVQGLFQIMFVGKGQGLYKGKQMVGPRPGPSSGGGSAAAAAAATTTNAAAGHALATADPTATDQKDYSALHTHSSAAAAAGISAAADPGDVDMTGSAAKDNAGASAAGGGAGALPAATTSSSHKLVLRPSKRMAAMEATASASAAGGASKAQPKSAMAALGSDPDPDSVVRIVATERSKDTEGGAHSVAYKAIESAARFAIEGQTFRRAWQRMYAAFTIAERMQAIADRAGLAPRKIGKTEKTSAQHRADAAARQAPHHDGFMQIVRQCAAGEFDRMPGIANRAAMLQMLVEHYIQYRHYVPGAFVPDSVGNKAAGHSAKVTVGPHPDPDADGHDEKSYTRSYTTAANEEAGAEDLLDEHRSPIPEAAMIGIAMEELFDPLALAQREGENADACAYRCGTEMAVHILSTIHSFQVNHLWSDPRKPHEDMASGLEDWVVSTLTDLVEDSPEMASRLGGIIGIINNHIPPYHLDPDLPGEIMDGLANDIAALHSEGITVGEIQPPRSKSSKSKSSKHKKAKTGSGAADSASAAAGGGKRKRSPDGKRS